MEADRVARARRYVRLPEECVSLCTENLGIQTSGEVTSALVEDVSFRIRQVTKLALEFMSHANRKRVCKEDFDNALKWSGIEPVYGHTVEPPPFVYIHENSLFSVEDQEVSLQDLSLSPAIAPSSLPPPPSLSAHWLVVEGVPVETEGLQYGLPGTVHLKKSSNESHQKYLSLLMEAITGESEEIRRIALTDMQTNPSIANILPDLVQYLLETLSCWVQFRPGQLMKALRMLYCLVRNKHFFLDPYGTRLFPLVKGILLTQSYQHTGPTLSHWHIRQMAAMCLAEITGRCATPINEYVPDINASFHQVLSQSDVPLQVLYGVVLALCQLGGKSLSEVLFPRLDSLCHYTQSFFTSRDVTKRDTAMRVHESLLVSAETLLMSGVAVDVKPEHISSSFSSISSLQPSLSSQFSGGKVGGEHDNSFLSSFGPTGKSIMDTSDLNMGGPHQENLPSLYEFLVELFGETLIHRLTAHLTNVTVKKDKKKELGKSPVGPSGRVPNERVLLEFLTREGFRPYKVQLPLKPLPRKPPAFHPWGRQLWRFQIPTTLLPVQTNMLEEEGRWLQRGRQRERAVLPKDIGRLTGRKHRTTRIDLGVICL